MESDELKYQDIQNQLANVTGIVPETRSIGQVGQLTEGRLSYAGTAKSVMGTVAASQFRPPGSRALGEVVGARRLRFLDADLLCLRGVEPEQSRVMWRR